nr:MAG TPA: hypothetical protein [Caudoviricetes sp.]
MKSCITFQSCGLPCPIIWFEMGVRVLYSLTVYTLAAYLELHFR